MTDEELREEFEKIWKIYPRKLGKKNAFTSYIKLRRKFGKTFEEVAKGALGYAFACELKGTDPQFIKHGSTFFNPNKFGDWAGDEYDDENAPGVLEALTDAETASAIPSTDRLREMYG